MLITHDKSPRISPRNFLTSVISSGQEECARLGYFLSVILELNPLIQSFDMSPNLKLRNISNRGSSLASDWDIDSIMACS